LVTIVSPSNFQKISSPTWAKTLLLTYFLPCDDPLLTDEMWIEGAKTHFDEKVIARKDLMET